MQEGQSARRWSVLILCTGYSKELLRSTVAADLERLGFEARVYDLPGYPVDPLVHSHAACVEAIADHDVVLVFADESEGGDFQASQAPVAMVHRLRAQGILPPEGSACPSPTILQVEILTARTLGKPTLVFVPRTVQAKVDQAVQLMRSGSMRLRQVRIGPVPSSKALIAQSNWRELSAHYAIAGKKNISLRQIAFLELLRKDAPNFISYYDLTNAAGLLEEIRSRLGGAAFSVLSEHIQLVERRIEQTRNPIATSSINDLLRQGLLLPPPYTVASGENSTKPLYSLSAGEPGLLAELVAQGRCVLLLGWPGLGKTTACLLAFKDLANMAMAGTHGMAPLFGSWRDLHGQIALKPVPIDHLVRVLLSAQKGRAPWPDAIPLPHRRWLVVLDGLDEAQLDRDEVMTIMDALSKADAHLVSCRTHDFERQLHATQSYFHVVVQLTPWTEAQISAFAAALRTAGRVRAAAYIDRYIRDKRLPNFLSLPLWLNMLSFLADRLPPGRETGAAPQNDYELLRQCAHAVAEEEVRRHGPSIDAQAMRKMWARAAWELHLARRRKTPLLLHDLEMRLGIQDDGARVALVAFLDTFGREIRGFVHEVFYEYWLAEHLVDQLADVNVQIEPLARQLAYMRPVVTNRLMRLRIINTESVPTIVARLMQAFHVAGQLGEWSHSAQNQVIYLLGRVDFSDSTRGFLSTVWRSTNVAAFVRHSAAFAAVMQGDAAVEDEFYRLLDASPADDCINRGYHLSYYGDIELREDRTPPNDNGRSLAEATLRQLILRLRRTEPRHQNLRRIELLTIRRFLETGRKIPVGSGDLAEAAERVATEARDYALHEGYAGGVESEVRRILHLLKST